MHPRMQTHTHTRIYTHTHTQAHPQARACVHVHLHMAHMHMAHMQTLSAPFNTSSIVQTRSAAAAHEAAAGSIQRVPDEVCA